MADKKLYGGSGVFNDRPRNPYSSRPGEAAVGIASQYQGQPSLGDYFGAEVLAPLPNIVRDNVVRSNGTAFWERFNPRLAPAVEQKSAPRPTSAVERKPLPTKADEAGSIAGLFAGVSPFEVGPKSTPSQVPSSSQGARGESAKGTSNNDDDMKFLNDMLEKKFGYEKRGASIRQGMANAAQGNTQLHSISNALMGLG